MANSVVNAREAAKQYLSSHNIPQMFESLISCLMLQRPEDPVEFIEKKMKEIREVGVENVNWETFVRPLHPYRDPVRLAHVRDGSKFDKEREDEEEVEMSKDKGKEKSDNVYEPDVFQLTEPQ